VKGELNSEEEGVHMQAVAQDQYVEFGIELERYAIRIEEIHEIIKMPEISEILNVLSYVKGVINLRGKIIPVISLRNLFNFEENGDSNSTRIMVVNHREETVGVIVDRVNKVATFSDIQPPPEYVGGIDRNLFAGIGLTGDGLVGILKLDEILINE
jgi:purine-binding chemotaxis protein CheW